jgi:hypothetical protein
MLLCNLQGGTLPNSTELPLFSESTVGAGNLLGGEGSTGNLLGGSNLLGGNLLGGVGTTIGLSGGSNLIGKQWCDKFSVGFFKSIGGQWYRKYR